MNEVILFKIEDKIAFDLSVVALGDSNMSLHDGHEDVKEF